MGLASIELEGVEADDVIASLCRLAVADGRKAVIVSGDKDFYQLLSESVSMWDPSPKAKSALDLDGFRARFGLEPAAFLEMQALMGDPSDNIPGIKGIGEGTALKLITEFGTVERLYESLDKVKPQGVRAKLEGQLENARLSKSLATLGEGLEPPLKLEDLAVRDPDLPKIEAITRDLELARLYREIEAYARVRSRRLGGSYASAASGESGTSAGTLAPGGSAMSGAPGASQGPGSPEASAGSQGASAPEAPAASALAPPREAPAPGPQAEPGSQAAPGPQAEPRPEGEPRLDGARRPPAAGRPKGASLLDGLRPDPVPLPTGDAQGSLAAVPGNLLGAAGAIAAPADDVVDYDLYRLVDDEESWGILAAALERSERLAVDLETDGPKPGRAAIVGISLATGPPGEAFYIPVAHATAGARNQPWPLVAERLGARLIGPAPPKVGQHAKFDWQILARYGLVLPVPADDPMLASYLLDPDARHGLDALSQRELEHRAISFKEVVPNPKATFASVDPATACRYSAEDADLTLRLAAALRGRLEGDPELLRLYDEVELPLEELLGRMEGLGVLVDPAALKTLSAELGAMMSARAKTIYSLIGHELNLGSPKQLGEALFVEMGLPAGKKTAKGTAPSTDNEVLSELALLYPVASEIMAWREVSKLKSTYADKLPEAIDPATGRIHTSYNQALTATGRLSSSDPNLQNIPARTEEGRRVRAAFKAPPGWRLLSADYSQIELRVMAHLSGDQALMRAFLEDEDIHAQTAARIFNLPIDKVPPERRREAKTINFGIIYGQGPFGLAKQLGVRQSEAKAIIDAYFLRFPGVRAYMDRTVGEAARTGQVRTWFGRLRRLPLIGSSGPAKREAERMAVNTPVQGTAADLIKMAMLMVDRALAREGLKSRIIMQVHDELVLEAPLEEVDRVGRLVKELMELAGREPLAGGRPLTVPLRADVAVGEAWVHA
jgi:DNA polymerase I-like protein with 3'-5' exonuclease and polymerase domains